MKLKQTAEGYYSLMNDQNLHSYCIHKSRVEVPGQDYASINPQSIQLITMDSQTSHCGNHCPFFIVRNEGDIQKNTSKVELLCATHIVHHPITGIDVFVHPEKSKIIS